MIILGIIAYVVLAAACVAGLFIARAAIDDDFDPEFDSLGPVICGVFWPIAAPIYAAYLFAEWYTSHRE